jgi:hypothetical protein
MSHGEAVRQDRHRRWTRTGDAIMHWFKGQIVPLVDDGTVH